MPLYKSNIPTITPDEDFVEVMECDYKGEHYSVRDNGAIMRHAREGKQVRKDDNTWTFGTKNESNGYMYLCGARVHIIVATAFFGERDSQVYVVDHKDINRCNNRPTNLRWLTKLENALNNPATRKKIVFLCGSIENFINDPTCLRDATGTNQDVAWMRTVTAEEAKTAYDRIMEWAEKPSSETPSKGGKMDEWIYRPQTVADLRFTDGRKIESSSAFYDRPFQYDAWGNPIGPKPSRREQKELKENGTTGYFKTNNPLAEQLGWSPYTKPEFPCCPEKIAEDPIQNYAANFIEGKVFVSATYGVSKLYKYAIHDNQLLVVTKIPNGAKNFGLARVMWNGKVFIHESMGTYFEENGVMAAFTRAQGLEWDGPGSIDDDC